MEQFITDVKAGFSAEAIREAVEETLSKRNLIAVGCTVAAVVAFVVFKINF